MEYRIKMPICEDLSNIQAGIPIPESKP